MSMIQTYRNKLDKLLADHRHAARQVQEEKIALQQAKEQAEAVLEAQGIVQQIAEQVQVRVHAQIAGVVTRCLQTVFGEEYGFRIDFARKRGRTEAKLAILKDNLVLDDPLNECGGGVIDLAALSLRLICLVLTRPKQRRLLILDEPFRNLNGEENRQHLVELLPVLAEEMGVQFILATGNDWLRVGKVINIGDGNGTDS